MIDFSSLLDGLDAARRPPASRKDVERLERATELKLPVQFRDLMFVSDGFSLKSGDRFLDLAAIEEYWAGLKDFGIPQRWGYLPFTDFNDSNPYCICCNSPLQGMIAHVFHDDSARLEFRTLESFLLAFQGQTSDLSTDYSPLSKRRTENDIRVGLELIELSREMPDDVEQGDALRFAVSLLSENEISVFAELLNTGDEYTREEVLHRLHRMTSPNAVEIITAFNAEMRSFVTHCVNGLRQAGIDVVEVKDHCPRLEPGPVWLNLPVFFDRRQSPTIVQDIVERARHLMKLKG